MGLNPIPEKLTSADVTNALGYTPIKQVIFMQVTCTVSLSPNGGNAWNVAGTLGATLPANAQIIGIDSYEAGVFAIFRSVSTDRKSITMWVQNLNTITYSGTPIMYLKYAI